MAGTPFINLEINYLSDSELVLDDSIECFDPESKQKLNDIIEQLQSGEKSSSRADRCYEVSESCKHAHLINLRSDTYPFPKWQNGVWIIAKRRLNKKKMNKMNSKGDLYVNCSSSRINESADTDKIYNSRQP